jgi:hypothetical protein
MVLGTKKEPLVRGVYIGKYHHPSAGERKISDIKICKGEEKKERNVKEKGGHRKDKRKI